MSDTPRTAEAKIKCGFQAVPDSFLQFARELERENAALRADKERLEATLDGITAANERAIKRWQAAHPGKELVIPDQAKMVEWLLEQLAKFDDPHRLHAHCVRHLTDAQVAHLFGERMTEIQNDRDKLQSENIALRELTATLGAPNHLGVPVPLYRELRADKARLDWLDEKGCWLTIPGQRNFTSGPSRWVIDRAMQEAKQ